MNGIANSRTARAAADWLPRIAVCSALAMLLFGSSLLRSSLEMRLTSLPPIDSSEPFINGSGFEPDAVFPTTVWPDIKTPIRRYGSWLKTDASTGKASSPWYRPLPSFSLFVAGYPENPGNHLLVEAVRTDHHVDQFAIPINTTPNQRWLLQTFTFPRAGRWTKFRIIAIDGATGHAGWLGFSEPLSSEQESGERVIVQALALSLATATAFLLFLAPGLVLRMWYSRRVGRTVSFVWFPIPGLALTTLLGWAAWKLPLPLSAASTCWWGIGVIAVVCGYWFFSGSPSAVLDSYERRALLIVFVLAFVAIAKASYSLGPEGELYGGTISRTLEVGNRSDSRINYILVQLAATRKDAFGPFATSLFSPYNFSHRGPIAGLAASPLVLAWPVQTADLLPDQAWSLLDPQGFALYRLAMMVMACCMLCVVLGLARSVLPEKWAFLAFLVVATTPFVMHEIYFTWPKLVAGCFVLLAACLCLQMRFFWAGFALGLGYLSHPSALLSLPSLIAIVLLAKSGQNSFSKALARRIWDSCRLGLGLGVWLLFWRFVNGSHYGQTGFAIYFKMAGGLPPTLLNWLTSRWQSLLNTLVPLHLFIFDRADLWINSISAPSPPVVTFFFQYLHAVPFAVGILFFISVLYALYLSFKKMLLWTTLVFVVPFLLFTAYWGATPTGMVREGLHAWLLGLLCLVVFIWHKFAAHSGLFWKFSSVALLFRGIETLAMMLLPTFVTQKRALGESHAFSDSCCLALMFAGVSALSVYTFYYSEQLRKQGTTPLNPADLPTSASV